MFAFNITQLYIFLTFSVIYEWALIMTCLLGLELGALKFDAACQLYHALSGQLFKVAWLTSLSPLNTLGLSDSPAYYKLRLVKKRLPIGLPCSREQQMRQGRHRFSSLPKIQQELTKLIKNPKRFCDISNTTNVQGLRQRGYIRRGPFRFVYLVPII